MNLYRLFCGKLTIKRLINYILLRLEYFISYSSKTPFIHAKPFAASIEPANYCNLQCPECPTGMGAIQKEATTLPFPLFKKMINPLLPELFYLNLYFQGEPFLNESIYDMIAYANRQKIITNISTNGHFLTDSACQQLITSKLDRIIISLDGATEETYEKYRVGGNFTAVVDGITRLVRLKKEMQSRRPFIELQFIVFSTNEHEIPAIKVLAKSLQVDGLSIKTAQLTNFKKGNPLMPKNTIYSRYKLDKNGSYKRKKPLRNRCWKNWSSIVVSTDGKVLPCCFDKHGLYAYGNLLDNGFHSLWNGDKATKFRSTILHNRKSLPMCNNCTE
ncbi:MAG: SPASM domain-containing protein [Paludibacteraceae bacterium]|nr:SPASM domain-containing protein [Paludibacteraceae bacterium]MBP8627538.1 SPASM domain-containing protein [Paludibacteraceae bacterium]MBP8782213.1 SPASM domain-containing protein [Paludibacteraceae bacterium]MBP9648308.1 SPASM domain-containing protein [Paludibacteraceae bacterium]MBP9970557.1 SPASM domain-containing protein [Paludibacteraceae bacterium]